MEIGPIGAADKRRQEPQTCLGRMTSASAARWTGAKRRAESGGESAAPMARRGTLSTHPQRLFCCVVSCSRPPPSCASRPRHRLRMSRAENAAFCAAFSASCSIHLLDVLYYFIGNESCWLRGKSTSSDSLPLLNGILNFFARRPLRDPSRLPVNVSGRLIL